jgi:hypothetical protein
MREASVTHRTIMYSVFGEKQEHWIRPTRSSVGRPYHRFGKKWERARPVQLFTFVVYRIQLRVLSSDHLFVLMFH